MKNMKFAALLLTAAMTVAMVGCGSSVAANTVNSKDDLPGKKIGVQLGTTGDTYSSENVKDAKVEQYSKGFEAVQALTQGKIDAVVIDQEPAKVFVNENEGIKLLDEPLTSEDYAYVIKKGNTELVEKVNKALAELTEAGEIQSIIDKYNSEE